MQAKRRAHNWKNEPPALWCRLLAFAHFGKCRICRLWTVSDLLKGVTAVDLCCASTSEKVGGQSCYIVEAGAILVAVEKLGKTSEHR